MEKVIAFLENAKGFVNQNYALSGLLFVVITLALAGKPKAALIVAASAGVLCFVYTLISAHAHI